MNDTYVVNLYKEQYDVYIGRPGKGQSGYFGNPFNEGSQEEKIRLFREHFYKRIKQDREFAKRVHKLKGKRLGCFCKPKLCHGDVIAEYLNGLPDSPHVRMAVVGSREFSDYIFLGNILKWYNISRIISGGAKGADSLARRYANEHGIPIDEFIPEWDTYGKSAGYKRNEKIIEAADEVIAFWNGSSKGTKHSINIANEAGKPVYVYWPDQKSSISEDEICHLG